MDNKAIDFFAFVCLGITVTEAKDNKEKALEKCFYRAYLDMNRTIRYKDEVKKDETSKKKFLKAVLEIIKNFYDNLPSSELKFDENHEIICKAITTEGNKYVKEKFSDGQSQKILNMTLKYLMLLGDEKVCQCKGLLHVPIDNYIVKAIWNSKEKLSVIPYKDEYKNKCPGKFNTDKFIAWSQWDYDDTYANFQKYIKKLKGDQYSSCIEWENDKWIANAENK